jgi:hypothetical protein
MKMQVVTIRRTVDNIGEHISISCEKDNTFKSLAAVFSGVYSNGFYGCSYQPDGTFIESSNIQTFDDFVKEAFSK